jgi:hypothetical protein
LPSFKAISAGIPIFLCLSSLSASSQPPLRFPQVDAYTLAKTKVTLPEQLAAPYDLLLLSFDPDQVKQLEDWIGIAQSLENLHPVLRYYALPVSSRENLLFRWWQNSSDRSTFSDPEIWPWVVPLYVDRTKFEHDLQITDTHTVAILLTDKSGNVLWRYQGQNTAAARAQIERVISHQAG